MTPAPQPDLREALDQALTESFNLLREAADDIRYQRSDPAVLADFVRSVAEEVRTHGKHAADLIARAEKAEREAVRPTRLLLSDAELEQDPALLIRHLEEQCRDFINERNEWKAVVDREAAERDAATTRAEAAEAEIGRLREALTSIDDMEPATTDLTLAHEMALIARAALKPQEAEDGN